MKNTLTSNSLIVDSGFWIALANPRDRHHALATAVLTEYETQLFISTWPVIVESSHLIFRLAGQTAQFRFLRNIEAGGCDLFSLGEAHWPRVIELMHQYRDLPMDLADASLVILAEELGHGRILSTDERDFHAYRWKNHEPFENWLLCL